MVAKEGRERDPGASQLALEPLRTLQQVGCEGRKSDRGARRRSNCSR